MVEIKKPRLDDWWQDKLNNMMEEHYPEVIGESVLVASWKRDGWNDGTTALFGVYQLGSLYRRCCFPDYGEPENVPVQPTIEHTGWHVAVTPMEGQMVTETHKFVLCTKCPKKAALPITADGMSIRIAALDNWKFNTDDGWVCPDHTNDKEGRE